MAESHKVVDGEKIVHEYDGILESDNRLPRWWLATFFGSIAFAAIYWLGYQTFKVIDNTDEAFRKASAASASAEAERLKSMGTVSAELLLSLSHNESAVAAGKATFGSLCSPCHAANGGGGIGPNLTDKYWLHGGSPEKVYRSIRDGWVEQGMKAWGPDIGEQKVREVAAYVLTLKNSNVAGGKEPKGTEEP